MGPISERWSALSFGPRRREARRCGRERRSSTRVRRSSRSASWRSTTPARARSTSRFVAAGLCHSDLHMMDGDLTPRLPDRRRARGRRDRRAGRARGDEGRGRATTWSAASSPAAASAATAPPAARTSATWGHHSRGQHARRTFRFHDEGRDYGAFCMLGAFSEYATVSEHSVVKVDDWLPLDTAVLVGCGVPDRLGHRRERRRRAPRRHRRSSTGSAGSGSTPCRARRTPAPST